VGVAASGARKGAVTEDAHHAYCSSTCTARSETLRLPVCTKFAMSMVNTRLILLTTSPGTRDCGGSVHLASIAPLAPSLRSYKVKYRPGLVVVILLLLYLSCPDPLICASRGNQGKVKSVQSHRFGIGAGLFVVIHSACAMLIKDMLTLRL
jgi:hypothetical protein